MGIKCKMMQNPSKYRIDVNLAHKKMKKKAFKSVNNNKRKYINTSPKTNKKTPQKIGKKK
jgi:hypothetical protein